MGRPMTPKPMKAMRAAIAFLLLDLPIQRMRIIGAIGFDPSQKGDFMYTAAARFGLCLCLSLSVAIASPAHAQQSGRPQYGSWGFDTAGEDTGVKPGDDFFRYANGHWLDTHQIPADKPGVSLRLEMTDRTETRLHEMMEQAAGKATHQPGDLEGKMGAFYKSFMDGARAEQLATKPIVPELDAVRNAQTRDALAGLMCRNQSDFEGTL